VSILLCSFHTAMNDRLLGLEAPKARGRDGSSLTHSSQAGHLYQHIISASRQLGVGWTLQLPTENQRAYETARLRCRQLCKTPGSWPPLSCHSLWHHGRAAPWPSSLNRHKSAEPGRVSILKAPIFALEGWRPESEFRPVRDRVMHTTSSQTRARLLIASPASVSLVVGMASHLEAEAIPH
jgi:hypothetical protein